MATTTSVEENVNVGSGGGGGSGVSGVAVGGEKETVRQSTAWKRYILWEKSNPLNLENHQELMKRG